MVFSLVICIYIEMQLQQGLRVPELWCYK